MASSIGVCCEAEGSGERKEMGRWEVPGYSDLATKHD